MHVRYLQHQHSGTVQLLLMPLSTAASSIKSTKWVDDDDDGDCDTVPLPIQTFLWRQTNPFLGAKVGKLHEASCVTFERVVVQNILHGLSPSLSDAIAQISRWKLIRAALPHVVQCCGSLLEAAAGERKLSSSLQKILYILHWMLLDSASECTDGTTPKDEQRSHGLFSISSIQLFVYLIAPLAEVVTEEEISSSIRLESGLGIWQALWQYRQPDVMCFCAPVKQRRDELPMITYIKKQVAAQTPASQGIYLGEELSTPRRPSIVPPPKPPRQDKAVLDEKRRREEEQKKKESHPQPIAPLVVPPPPIKPTELLIEISGSNEKSTGNPNIVRSVSEYKTIAMATETRKQMGKSQTTNAFDISPTSETSLRMIEDMENAMRFVEENNSLSAEFCSDEAPLVQLNDICSSFSVEPGEGSSETASCEVICERCKRVVFREGTVVGSCGCKVNGNLKIVTRDAPGVTLTRASTTEEKDTLSSCSQLTVIPATTSTTVTIQTPSTTGNHLLVQDAAQPAQPKRSVARGVSRVPDGSGTDDELEEIGRSDPSVATYLDVAVIRALLIPHWHEQGVYWAMRFLFNRLQEIQAFTLTHPCARNRSNSLPSGERKPEVSVDIVFQNATWDDFRSVENENEHEDKEELHVAFNDVRRKSSDVGFLNALKGGHQSRRASLNTFMKKDRNRSDPSLNNSVEVLSIREDTGSMDNLSAKSEKAADRTASKFYPEALGSSSFIERDGKLNLTVILQTINQVMERCPVVRLCEIALNISSTLFRTPMDQSENFFVQLSGLILRIYLALGCPYGCNDGVKSQQADLLRVKAKSLLADLEKLKPEKFKTILVSYVDENPLQLVLDLLHSATSFCRSEMPIPDHRRSSDPNRQPTYRNKFNEKEKGIEGRIIHSMSMALVTRLSAIQEQLVLPENMSLLQDVRMFVNFIQDQHGNPFRRVGLSALLHAISQVKKDSVEESTKDDSSGKSSPSGLAPPMARNEQASLRRGLFKKREKSGGNDDSDADSSPSTPRTISSMDEGNSSLVFIHNVKKKSAPKLLAFNLLKSDKKSEQNGDDGGDSDSEVADEMSEIDTISAKRVSTDSIRKTRGPTDSMGNLTLWGEQIPIPKLVDIKAVFEGTRRFAFLLETTRPGTFPDPPLIGALLFLKSPVLARASLLLECAHFVSRCNRGQWPDWIRSAHHRTLSLGGPLANRGTPSATRRMHSLQRSAGRYFYQWALQISEQLSRAIDKTEGKHKKILKFEDCLEDFFDDALVNDNSGERCPPALQMIALLLLQEITAFLRDTFRTIPRTKDRKQQPSSGWEKLLSHRRWSILSNTFNPQQTGSITSIADINPNLHFSTHDRERRISLSTAEEDSPRGSKDAIDSETIDKRALTSSSSIRPPSLSVRLLSRQSTHDESGGSAQGSTKSSGHVTADTGSFGRRIAGRQRLLKRGSPMGQQPSLESSHKRRSFRMRKQSKPIPNDDSEERDHPVSIMPLSLSARDSLKMSEEPMTQSPTDSAHPPTQSQTNSQHSTQGHHIAAKTSLMDEEEQHILNHFPWLKVVIRMAHSWDFACQHEGFCSERCFFRVFRQCGRITEALSTLYGMRRTVKTRVDKRKLLIDKWNNEQQALRRSVHSRQSAAVPRRESAMVGPTTEYGSKAIKMLLMEKMQQEKEQKEKEKKEEKDKEDAVSKKISVQDPDNQSDNIDDEVEEDINQAMLDYIKTMALNLMHSPLSTVLKSILLLSSEQFKQMIQVSWNLLVASDPHVVLSAASMFIVSSVKRPEDCVAVMKAALESENPTERTEAIQRFYALWRNRFHVWLKMEDGAQTIFKVPPPGIDFTLPSPPIGQSQLPVVDPPWMPHTKTKIEELSLKEEEHATSQTIMTMTRTRRKQKQEMVKRAVREAEERQCEQRQLFKIRGSAIVQQAAYEPALFHHQQEQNEEGEPSHFPTRHQIPVAQPLFPSTLLAAVPMIIEMLDDPYVDKNGIAVSDVAKKTIWTCMVEDPSLFLRHFLEKLTNRERQEHLMSILRKLILRFNPLPSQAAYTLLNYLFGFVMHYVRAQCEGADKAIGMALSLAWILAPHVHGLYFKDLKQTLKKEQCDQALMITANVPSAKKIIVHGPDSGVGGIPSQFPVHEDTQFQQILSDSLEFFNIDEADVNSYFLTDAKTGLIHLPAAYVRDYYFFHRSLYPQLALVKLDQVEAETRMRLSAFSQKFIEVGKVLLTHNILKYSPQQVIAQRVFFLHDELTHLPSFPRKSLETCFGMFYGPMGDQLKAIESLHKFTWAKLMADMFEKMENAFMFADLHLFINVVNGIMIMHCEDVLILRRCAATYLSMAIHFNTLFASQGFFLIMPTLLRCYSQRQTNGVFCGVVEFLCRQFYTLHRKPFLLQMCGSIASILDHSNDDFEINPMRVKAKYWFNLLKKMEEMSDEADQFDILGLVPYDKPLKALDLCYRDDPNTFCLLTDCIASCICVCAIAPESRRSHHMLLVMQALLPHVIRRMEEDTSTAGNAASAVKHEIAQWTTLCVEMKALVNSCETLARAPTRAFDTTMSANDRGKSFVADSPQFFDPPTTNEDENSRPHHLKEKRSTAIGWETSDVEEQHKEAYRRPRDTLLCLSAKFIEMATPRLKDLGKLPVGGEHPKIPEPMDHKCHVKLGEIALALLKIAPYDLTTMSCPGLQKYFTTILPVTDWSIESNRSALNIILRRLDKTMQKIAKKQSVRRRVSWPALSQWINGICNTLSAFPYIAHLHPLKTTTQLCLRIMVGDPCNEEGAMGANHPATVLFPTTPPQIFCQSVLRLTTILMQYLGQMAFSIEFVTSIEGMGTSADRLEAVLCHVLVPLFLRVSRNTKEASVLQSKELSFCLQMMQNAVSPPIGKPSVAPLMSTSTLATTFIRDVSGRQGSVSVTDRGHSATVSTLRIVRESVCQCIYLALKVLMLSFSKLLTPHWAKVAKLVKDLLAKKPGAPSAIQFIDFLLHCDLPITLLIWPVIHNKLKQKPACEADMLWQAEINEHIEKHQHQTLPIPVLLHRCHNELQLLKEELSMKPLEVTRSYTPTMVDAHSDSSAASLAPRGASSRQSLDRRASSHGKKMLPTMKEGNEGTIPEDVEDETGETNGGTEIHNGGGGGGGNGNGEMRVTKSPSMPLNKVSQSPRNRSIGNFGMWRSVRRKSRPLSMTDSESERERSVELHDLPVVRIEPKEEKRQRPTEIQIQPMVEVVDRHRFVSFSTTKRKNNDDDDDVFQITEQHQLV